ncbi:MAG: MotA/TolQ/ExbB proton channel family protein [Myxococcales bacterium]|nr:MotA/TolQ/ExbB proton channel family protein [Myxococcales bacterium]
MTALDPLASAPTMPSVALDPVQLVLHASLAVKVTVAILGVASTMVWTIALVKLLQLGRLRSRQRGIELAALASTGPDDLVQVLRRNRQAPGGRVLAALLAAPAAGLERLRAIADRAIVAERLRASSFASPLGSVAASAPFIGLFGTVYGIMDAFMRIGAEKSASLPTVAPAIGEALVTTAIGLATAIPAVVFFNMIDKRVADLIAEVEASASEWVALLAEHPPLGQPVHERASLVALTPARARPSLQLQRE